MDKKIAFGALLIPLFLVAALPALALAPPASTPQKVPFVGLQMEFIVNGPGFNGMRTYSFVDTDSSGNWIYVDTTDGTSTSTVAFNPSSGLITSCTGSDCGYANYVEIWQRPTALYKGATIMGTGTGSGTITGSAQLNVGGSTVNVWIAQISYDQNTQPGYRDTLYYEKSTGLLVGAQFRIMSGDSLAFSYGEQLINTNAILKVVTPQNP